MAGRNVVQSSMDGVRLSPHGTSPTKPDAYQRGKCHECKKSIHNNKNPKRDARHTRGGGTPGSRDGRTVFGAGQFTSQPRLCNSRHPFPKLGCAVMGASDCMIILASDKEIRAAAALGHRARRDWRGCLQDHSRRLAGRPVLLKTPKGCSRRRINRRHFKLIDWPGSAMTRTYLKIAACCRSDITRIHRITH